MVVGIDQYLLVYIEEDPISKNSSPYCNSNPRSTSYPCGEHCRHMSTCMFSTQRHPHFRHSAEEALPKLPVAEITSLMIVMLGLWTKVLLWKESSSFLLAYHLVQLVYYCFSSGSCTTDTLIPSLLEFHWWNWFNRYGTPASKNNNTCSYTCTVNPEHSVYGSFICWPLIGFHRHDILIQVKVTQPLNNGSYMLLCILFSTAEGLYKNQLVLLHWNILELQ